MEEEISAILDNYIGHFRIKEGGKLSVNKAAHEKTLQNIVKVFSPNALLNADWRIINKDTPKNRPILVRDTHNNISVCYNMGKDIFCKNYFLVRGTDYKFSNAEHWMELPNPPICV